MNNLYHEFHSAHVLGILHFILHMFWVFCISFCTCSGYFAFHSAHVLGIVHFILSELTKPSIFQTIALEYDLKLSG